MLIQDSSLIIEHLKHWTSSKERIPIAYLYCDYSDSDKQKTSSLLSCLAYQLLNQHPSSCWPEAKSSYERYHSLGTNITTGDAFKLLKSIVTGLADVFIVIDALDECLEDDGRRKSLISGLSNLMPFVRLLVFSRDLPDIRRQFKNAMCVEIRAHDGDIMKYIDNRVANAERLSTYTAKDDGLGKLIRITIARKACGM